MRPQPSSAKPRLLLPALLSSLLVMAACTTDSETANTLAANRNTQQAEVPAGSGNQSGGAVIPADDSTTGDVSADSSPKQIPCSNNDTTTWCAGIAVESIAPSAKHIAGVPEADGPNTRNQKFGLGGYGDVAGLGDPSKLNISAGDATGNYTNPEDLGQEQAINVRVMYLTIPGKPAVLFVTLDAAGTGNLIQKGIKTTVSKATGVPIDNILVGSTHSHSAPDLQGLWGGVPATWLSCTPEEAALIGCGEDDKWTGGLYQRAAAAAKRAKDQAVKVRLETATQEVNLNGTRSPKAVPDMTTDQALTVLRAVALGTDETVATLVQYAAHPTILGSDNRLTHSDYVNATLRTVEKALGGRALYYNGPIGDASARDNIPNSCDKPDGNIYTVGSENVKKAYCRANSYGKSLGGAAVRLINNSDLRKPVDVDLAVGHRTAVLPVTNPLFVGAGAIRAFNRYYNFVETPADDIPQINMLRNSLPQLAPTASTTVSRITLGKPQNGKGLEMATIPGEGRNGLGQLLRKLAYGPQSKGKPMMLLGLTHNSFGYIIPEEEFGGPLPKNSGYELIYEETVSLGPLTAPLLRYQAYFPLFNVAPEFYAPAYLTACQGSPDSDACLVKILQFRSPGPADVMNLPNEFQR